MTSEQELHDTARVLIVDDEPTSRLLTRDALEESGFLVEEADGGNAALAAFERARPALVLLDVEMPDMDGFEVCRKLRARSDGKLTPIVMMTSLEDFDSINNAYAAGATDFIVKPVNWALLGHRARYILRSSDTVRSLSASEEKFRLITENATDLIALLDREGRRLYNSPSYHALFGDGESGVGTDSFQQIHPEDRERIRGIFRETVESGVGQQARYRWLLKDGSVRFIESQSNVIRDESGQVSKVAVVSRDITERVRQQEKIDRLSRITAVLSGINSAIVRIRDRNELCEEACRIAIEDGQFELAWIGLLDRATMRIEPLAWRGDEQGILKLVRLDVGEDMPEGKGLASLAVHSKTPIVSNDTAADDRLPASKPSLSRGFRSLVYLPLLVDGEVAGVFTLYAAEPGFFSDAEMKLLEELAGDVSFGLTYIEREQKLHHLAYFDALTGLPNRRLYHERLATLTESSRTDSRRVVAVIDIKGFHIVNDNLGRHAGDTLLRLVAQRLRENLRATDTLGRLGGDQFGVILADIEDDAQFGPLMVKMLASLAEPFMIDSTSLHLVVKCGATVFPSETDGADADTLLTNAEAALGKAKASPEPYQFYAPHINAAIANRLSLESKLLRAQRERQFVLHYQPKVGTRSGRIEGLEALIRWNDPDRGLTPPDAFIPLLEETGMILSVGSWILRQAMMDLQKLRESGFRSLRIAVNVSAMQFRQRDFIGYLAAAIGNDAPPSGGLDIEITESVIMEDAEHHIAVLHEVRRSGIGVALDDFGTGYSSLSYLAQFPANTLKLDRSFVAGMAAAPEKFAIVSAVIALGHALGMKIVAEGVETEEQSKLLNQLGCDQLQGYLFARPAPLEQIEAMLAKQARDIEAPELLRRPTRHLPA